MKNAHVLYVEDDPVNAMLMQGILELRPGYVLKVARNGTDARRMATEGPIDLLLCDLHLPDIGDDDGGAFALCAGVGLALPGGGGAGPEFLQVGAVVPRERRPADQDGGDESLLPEGGFLQGCFPCARRFDGT